jgi:hypothetical protein
VGTYSPFFFSQYFVTLQILKLTTILYSSRYEWVTENCPTLVSITQNVVNDPEMREIWLENGFKEWVVPLVAADGTVA